MVIKMDIIYFFLIGIIITGIIIPVIVSSIFYNKPKNLPIIRDMTINPKEDVKSITLILIPLSIALIHLWPVVILSAGILIGLNLFI